MADIILKSTHTSISDCLVQNQQNSPDITIQSTFYNKGIKVSMKWQSCLHTREMSSSGCINLDVKPELDSGFFICGAPVIVALLLLEGDEVMAAAAGNVGFGGPAVDAGDEPDDGEELDD